MSGLERNLLSHWATGGLVMKGIIHIVSGLVIGGAGFYQIAVYPVQGVCALFLAGFLVMIGFEKSLGQRSQEVNN